MTPVVRICNYPGCTTLTDGKYRCPAHSNRDGRTARAWYRFSRDVISLAGGRCQLGLEGCTIYAKHAHRIGKGEHTLEHHLYRAACPHCHQVEHLGYGRGDLIV